MLVRFDRTIPPGGEGSVKISLNPKGCTGTTKKTAFVKTNDPKNPMLQLTVKGRPAS
jgi:hypothetical protein